jgi:hypothetical protein
MIGSAMFRQTSSTFSFLDQVGLYAAACDGVLLEKNRASSVYELLLPSKVLPFCHRIKMRSNNTQGRYIDDAIM